MKTKVRIMILLVLFAMLTGCAEQSNQPSPERLQVVNPMMKVSSAQEMASYLDFAVPVLDKPVDEYIVLVIDGYPDVGRIYYQDGSVFSMKYGEGDISGIYGGVPEKEETIRDVPVSFFTFEESGYAIWEMDGFTFCLTGAEQLETEVEAIIGMG